MASSDFQVRWADFKGGDWGAVDASRTDRDQWSGENMMVYRSGLLGTRAQLNTLNAVGLPNYAEPRSPRGFAALGDKLLLLVGNTVYTIPQAGGTVGNLYPAMPAGPYPSGEFVEFVVGNGVLYALMTLAGTLHKLPLLPGTRSAITTPVTFGGITRWGLWMVAFGTPGAGALQRIYFSLVDASGPNYDSWPVNNFYDVGNSDAVTALAAIFNTLLVGKREGWWAVSGVLGDLASIRDVAAGRGPPAPFRRPAVGPDNRVFYWSSTASGGGENVPTFFDGANPVATNQMFPASFSDDLLDASRSMCDQVAATPTGNRILLAYTSVGSPTSKLLMRDGKAWTRHSFPIQIAGLAPNGIREGSLMKPGLVYMAQQRGVGQAPVIVSWLHDTDRPGDGDMAVAAGTPRVTGTLQLPAFWEPNGRQVLARRVIVQFRKWSSLLDDTLNRLRLRVDALGQWANGPRAASVQEWSEAASLSPLSGGDDSVRFDFGDQGFGNGFQVVFEAVAGVAIREVVVEVSVERGR